MKAFMDKDFMLQSATAQHLYHDYAAGMPICDYHCHIPPREIYENRRFDNIAQVWLGGRNRRRIIFRWRSTHKQNCSQIQEAGVRTDYSDDPEPVQCICEIYHHKQAGHRKP